MPKIGACKTVFLSLPFLIAIPIKPIIPKALQVKISMALLPINKSLKKIINKGAIKEKMPPRKNPESKAKEETISKLGILI